MVRTLIARGLGSIPGRGTKIPQAMRTDQKKNNNNNNICDSWEQVKYQEFGRGLFQPSWMTLRGS